MSSPGRVILIDGGKLLSDEHRKALENSGFSITPADSDGQGIEIIRQESFDIALLVQKTRGPYDTKALSHLKQHSPNTAVIVIFQNEDKNSARNVIDNGAFDCLAEPFTPDALVKLVSRAASHARRVLEDTCIGQELDRMMLSQVLIGRSEPMQRVARFVRKAATIDTSVLITGESGTGKEVVARVIHRLSSRSNRRFVTVDCGHSTGKIIEGEMFGLPKEALPDSGGNKTGRIDLADGGTLFMDEIGEIDRPIQDKLLRVILEQKISSGGTSPDRKVDIRIISATTRDMSREVEEGNFREDLFYRLNTTQITIPPLRERLEDITPLADYYIRKFSAEKRRPAQSMSDEVLRSLQRREWPGNVRELIRLLEQAVDTCSEATIGIRDIPPETNEPADPGGESVGHLARMEKNEILRILEQFQGNKTQAAKYLGINRKTLREKMERYGINK